MRNAAPMRSKADPPALSLVNVKQIADLASVGMSAVSNWRRRFDDFPQPVDGLPGGSDVFVLGDVDSWLLTHGRLGEEDRDKKILWKAAELLRGELTAASYTEVLGAALALTAVGQRLGAPPPPLYELASEEKRWGAYGPRADDLFDPLGRLGENVQIALLDEVSRVDDPTSTFEYLLHRLNPQARTGWSSRAVQTEILTALIGDGAKSIFDPAAGCGGFLRAGSARNPRLFGQEINTSAARLARQRFLIANVPLEMAEGDSLHDDAWQGLRVDVVVADPPYATRGRWPDDLVGRFDWPTSPPKTLDLAWLQHCIGHLAESGRAYVFLPVGTLFRGGAEAAFRRALVERAMVEAIVTLPPGSALNTTIPIALWILRPADDRAGLNEVLLIDAAGAKEIPARREGGYIDRIAQALGTWRTEGAVPDHLRAFAVPVDASALSDFPTVLVPARWINQELSPAEQEAQTSELHELLLTGRRSQEQLPDALGAEGPIPRAAEWAPIKELSADGLVEMVKGMAIKSDEDCAEPVPLLRARDLTVSAGKRHKRAFVDGASLPEQVQLTIPGDVVVSPGSGTLHAIVDIEGGHVLQRPLQALRLHGDLIDPVVAAGFLESPRNRRFVTGSTYARVSLGDLELPRLGETEAATLAQTLRELQDRARLAAQVAAAAERAAGLVVSLSSISPPAEAPADAPDNSGEEHGEEDKWKRFS